MLWTSYDSYGASLRRTLRQKQDLIPRTMCHPRPQRWQMTSATSSLSPQQTYGAEQLYRVLKFRFSRTELSAHYFRSPLELWIDLSARTLNPPSKFKKVASRGLVNAVKVSNFFSIFRTKRWPQFFLVCRNFLNMKLFWHNLHVKIYLKTPLLPKMTTWYLRSWKFGRGAAGFFWVHKI